MKKYLISGILILIAGMALLFLGILFYVSYAQTVEHLKIECSKPGSSCPVAESNNYDIFLEIGTILSTIGIVSLVIHYRKR